MRKSSQGFKLATGLAVVAVALGGVVMAPQVPQLISALTPQNLATDYVAADVSEDATLGLPGLPGLPDNWADIVPIDAGQDTPETGLVAEGTESRSESHEIPAISLSGLEEQSALDAEVSSVGETGPALRVGEQAQIIDETANEVLAPEDLPEDLRVGEQPQVAVLSQGPDPAGFADEVVALTESITVGIEETVVAGVTWDQVDDEISVELRARDAAGEWTSWTAVEWEPGGTDVPAGTDAAVFVRVNEIQARVVTASGIAPAGLELFVTVVGWEGAGPPQDDSLEGDLPDGDLPDGDLPDGDAPGDAPGDVAAESVTQQVSWQGPTIQNSGNTLAGVAAQPTSYGAEPTTHNYGPAAAPVVQTSAKSQLSSLVAPRPVIRPRADWNAAPRAYDQPEFGDVRAITVHHTAGANGYSQAAVPGILRGIQNYHVKGREWADVGYNFLIDRFGVIWEGRAGGVENPIVGVHAGTTALGGNNSYNYMSSGISMIGNYDLERPSEASVDALISLIAWKAALHDVRADSVIQVGGYTRPAVVGHREVPGAATACPGRYLFPQLTQIRQSAAALQHSVAAVIDDGNLDPQRPQLVTNAGPGSTFYDSTQRTTPKRQIGHGWDIMNKVLVSSPQVRNGSPLIVATDKTTGQMFLYPTDGQGKFHKRVEQGFGWLAMSHIVAPGDWNRDGIGGDLLAVEAATGKMFFYAASGRNSYRVRTEIGHGWGTIEHFSAVGDLTGDGTPDVAAVVKGTGEVRIYPGDGAGGFASRIDVGYADPDLAAIMGPGDVTGDGVPDLIGMTRDGQLITFEMKRDGRARSAEFWGQGWDSYKFLDAQANWFGDGKSTIIGVDPTDWRLYAWQITPASYEFTAIAQPQLNSTAFTRTVVGDVTASGRHSIYEVRGNGRLYAYHPDKNGVLQPGVLIRTGLVGVRNITGAGDWNDDGIPDLLIQYENGTLLYYPISTKKDGMLGSPTQVGVGFGNYDIRTVQNWGTTGRPALLGRNLTTGDLRVWPVSWDHRLVGTGPLVGKGWLAMNTMVGGVAIAGEHNGQFLAFRSSDRSAWLYQSRMNGSIGAAVPVSGLTEPPGGLG